MKKERRFQARYAGGQCPCCGDPIEPGQMARYVIAHDDCEREVDARHAAHAARSAEGLTREQLEARAERVIARAEAPAVKVVVVNPGTFPSYAAAAAAQPRRMGDGRGPDPAAIVPEVVQSVPADAVPVRALLPSLTATTRAAAAETGARIQAADRADYVGRLQDAADRAGIVFKVSGDGRRARGEAPIETRGSNGGARFTF